MKPAANRLEGPPRYAPSSELPKRLERALEEGLEPAERSARPINATPCSSEIDTVTETTERMKPCTASASSLARASQEQPERP